MTSVIAGLLLGLALIYGIGAVGSLALRSARLAFTREWKLALHCAAYASGLAGAGVALSMLPNSDWPPPIYIPLYAGYISLCHYLANMLPKTWQRQPVVKGQA